MSLHKENCINFSGVVTRIQVPQCGDQDGGLATPDRSIRTERHPDGFLIES